MLTKTQRLSAVKELKRYRSRDVRQLANGIEFSFDYNGRRVEALVGLRGDVEVVQCGSSYFASTSKTSPITDVQREAVDGAIALAVKVTCFDESCLEVA